MRSVRTKTAALQGAAALFFLLTASCGNVRDSISTVPGERVFTAYSVSYDDSDRSLEALASFLA